jgi:hypothetical protein
MRIMTVFRDAPCESWDPIWCASLPTGSEAVSGSALAAATQVLWVRSGRRFGTCEYTIRPCRKDCLTEWTPWGNWLMWGASPLLGGLGGPLPVLLNGLWYNVSCGGCVGDCSCSFVDEILLPAPVAEVLEIKLDGVAIPTGSYRVDNRRLLVRTDGERWPLCNNLNLDDTEPGTWSVRLTVGEALPEIAQYAIGELALEFLRACAGDDCKLPRNLTQLVRQGVTINYPTPEDLRDTNLLGTYFCDLFLSTYNPTGMRSRSRIYSPDRPPIRHAGT